MSDAAPAKQPRNPWMVALTVLWVVLLGLAALLGILGLRADASTSDQPGLPPSHELAAIYYACSGITFVVTLVVIAVQLGVGALRWHLDPASRFEPAERDTRYVRQDF